MQSTLTAVDNIGLPLILEARLSRLNDMLLQWGTIQQKKKHGHGVGRAQPRRGTGNGGLESASLQERVLPAK